MALHVANPLVLTNNRAHNSGHIVIDDHSVLLSDHIVHQTLFEKHPNMRVLFDQAHEEQLNVGFALSDSTSLESPDSDDDQAESTQANDITLKNFLENELSLTIDKYENSERALGASLKDCNTFVLGGPTKPFSEEELESIVNFVFDGGSLLITGNYSSLAMHEEETMKGGNSLNSLLERFGLRAKQLLSYPPDQISEFQPHYISSEVNCIFLDEPFCLEIFSGTSERKAYTIATIPQTKEPFIVCIEFKYGRIVVVADTSIFDRYLRFGQNRQIVLNIFRWLTFNNLLDCWNSKMNSVVQRGQVESFSIELRNPHSTRLEFVNCFLDTHSSADIVGKNEQDLRSLPPYGEACLEWSIIPKRIGLQKLSLAISVAGQSEHSPIFFDSVAQFKCISDVEIEITILNNSEEVPEVIESGKSIEVKAVARHKVTDKKVNLSLELEATNFKVIKMGETSSRKSWQLMALAPGEWPVTINAKDINQKKTRLVHVKRTKQEQRKSLEEDVIPRLDRLIQEVVTDILPELSIKVVQDIPIRLLSPEEHVCLLTMSDQQKQLLEMIKIARIEDRRNNPLVSRLIGYLAPSYSPVNGCCIPYDPELARSLASLNPEFEDQLSQTFLILAGESQSKLERSLLSLILHEKYGHGFFFAGTTLGKQLSLLYKYGLTRNVVPGDIKQSYVRLLYQDYKEVIQAMWDSALIVNEGFATWLELALLPYLKDMSEHDASQRKRLLIEAYDPSYQDFISQSPYFKRFPPSYGSRYREGYEYLKCIEDAYEHASSEHSVLTAVMHATDIDFGIFEANEQVRFSLNASTLAHALLNDEDSYARATQRLRQLTHSYSTLM